MDDTRVREPGEDPGRPWTELGVLLAHDATARQIESYLEALPPGEVARAVSRLNETDRVTLLARLEPHDAAEVLEELPETQAAELIEQLAPPAAAAILHELPSNEQADLLGDITAPSADAILEVMDPDEARAAKRLSDYAGDVAGGLMITEFLAYPLRVTVGSVIADLGANAETYRSYPAQYAYVLHTDRRLAGVLPLRDLLLAPRSQHVEHIMITTPLTVPDGATLEDLEAVFEGHSFFAVPVLDDRERMLGIVLRSALEEALKDRRAADYRRSQGVVREELRSMPMGLRARRRLSWLSINIVLNIVAASVIALYQDTLAAVISLAVFLPIISDMSGCSGNQAVAVSMRELALGVVRPAEVLYVLGKEAVVGVANGTALGVLIAAVAWLWQGNAYLGLVVGGALALNTLLAVCIGGTVPLLLRRLGMDPALASGPILTTVTDMCGFFLVLSFATLLLPQLTAA